jgi:predicted sugar kinase
LAEYLKNMAETIVTALQDRDFDLFGEALNEYNRAAGEAFAEDQGGVYSSPEVEMLVGWIRNRGIPGVGQSSWGPTVFAICRDLGEAERIASELKIEFPNLEHVSVTNAANSGFRYEANN